MKLRTLISLKTEPMLEKWARFFRYTKADSVIQAKLARQPTLTVIDFGCGQDILYYKYLTQVYPRLAKGLTYIGIDPLVKISAKDKPKNVKIINKKFEQAKLQEKADVISIFAVLEHVDDPAALLRDATKHLKPDGVIVATTPSPLARLPLEFFSYILGIIAKREIDEHQRYPDRAFILNMGKKLPKFFLTHEYFELGLNNLCVVSKKECTVKPAFSFTADVKLFLDVISRAFKEV